MQKNYYKFTELIENKHLQVETQNSHKRKTFFIKVLKEFKFFAQIHF